MQNRFKIQHIMIILIISLTIFLLGFKKNVNITPKEVYKVFVDGRVVGTIESKNSFENYVNQQEEKIKQKYGVDKIYTPSGVEIKKITTYSNEINTNEETQ